jgi:nitrate/nitrite transporter NarK
MDNSPYQKLLTPVHHIIGLILTFLVFVLMSILLVPFTFSTNALIAQGQACLTATPITAGVLVRIQHVHGSAARPKKAKKVSRY